MFRARILLTRHTRSEARRRLCDKVSKPDAENEKIRDTSASGYNEMYKQLENLDFLKASKILFQNPHRKKRFGFDFHLVQFFFACMPSLAIYLVALYARREMKRMEAELEKEMKEEEKEKAEKLEKKKLEERERYLPEISEVKARLEKLEVTITEIAAQSKKDAMAKKPDEGGAANSKSSMETGTSERSKPENPIKPASGNRFRANDA